MGRSMLEVTFVGWATTLALIAALFILDLFISRPGHAHTVAFREAVVASLFYVGVALAFAVAFGPIAGWDWGVQYFAGYLVEKSLSVDNLFVFVVIMSTFAVPPEHQQRVLTFGILAALVMRAIFIALGAALISALSFMFLIFGALLIIKAVQLFRHRDQDPDIEHNALVRLTRRVLPITAIGGGMLRDVLLRETPTVLRQELYAIPALLGAGVVVAAHGADSVSTVVPIAGACLCFATRMIGLRYGIDAPTPPTEGRRPPPH
jgi:tellurite resistance protein TerC